MNILNVDRGFGKTTYCIERAYQTGFPILVVTNQTKRFIEYRIKKMDKKYKDVKVITYEEFKQNKNKYPTIIIDEAGWFFERLLGAKIDLVTM